MRLLTEADDGQFALTGPTSTDTPAYAILSHTWGAEADEVTFSDVTENTGRAKAGYNKIRFCAEQARRDGLQHFWIDTCCINKASDSELSEAINSMFNWYRNAERCYVYLWDVVIGDVAEGQQVPQSAWEAAFRASRWFTRGWTLQELIAPASVEFFAKDGHKLGDKQSLEEIIYDITGIAKDALRGGPLPQFQIDERFRWAEKRQTTRAEDAAYCLLGIFNVFISPIYGEGKEHAFRRLRKEIEGSIPVKEAAAQPFADIPFSRDPDFIDRGGLLARIEALASPSGSAAHAQTHHARVGLAGLGGVGKSQLAIAFAHRFAEAHPSAWVFWVHAATRARVEQGFKRIADALRLPDRDLRQADAPQLVYGWLANPSRSGRWLMVLDSADDGDVFYAAPGRNEASSDAQRPLAEFLPQSANGAILVTTRSRELALRLTGSHRQVLEVGAMHADDALLLLERKLGDLPDRAAAAQLADALDRIPLALSQAAAYIQARAPRTSVTKYLTEFRESERKRTRLLKHDGGDLRRDGGASNAVLSTWQISFDHIRAKRPSAADLLSLMSFFDSQGIPESLLREPSGQHQNSTAGSTLRPPSRGDDGDYSGSELDGFEDDIITLRDYSLIAETGEDGGVFEMHGLVQLATRKWLEAQGVQDAFRQQFLQHIERAFPTGEYENWATCQKLFPHVEVAMGHRPAADNARQEAWARLLYDGGRYAYAQGRYNTAEQMLVRARQTYEKLLKEDDKRLLDTTSQLAEVLRDKGQWQDAEALEVALVATCQRVLGPDHPQTLTSSVNLAATLRELGRWEEAEKLQAHVVETRKQTLGEDDADTLAAMAGLAQTYWVQGRWREAETLNLQVVAAYTKKLGATHPKTLESANNLATVYWSQGRWEAAKQLNMQVLEARKAQLGPEHPETLTTMGNLAMTYRMQGHYDLAEKLNLQVVEAYTTKLGPDHPDTLTSVNNLATTYWSLRRWGEAERLYLQVLAAYKLKRTPDHPDILTTTHSLASTYYRQGRWDEAEQLHLQVLAARRRKLGDDHPDTLASLSDLATTYWSQGRWEDAEKRFEEVAAAFTKKLGPAHPDTLTTMENLALAYQRRGRAEEAARLEAHVEAARRAQSERENNKVS